MTFGSMAETVRAVVMPILPAATVLAGLGMPEGLRAHADGHDGSESGKTELTLAQAVSLALRNNPGLVADRLDRTLQQYDLRVAEDRFAPELSFGTAGTEYIVDRRTNETTYRLTAGPLLRMRLPTGGTISAGPAWTAVVTRKPGPGEDRRSHSDGATFTFTFTQPLLKGGGLAAGRAPVRLARLREDRNVLKFKAAVMDVVTETIRTYRAAIQADLQARISERSLQRARETLEVNRALIEAGRMAERDITQTEADIARRELNLIRSRDRLDDARRDLRVLLDLDSTVRVIPTEPTTVQTIEGSVFDVERSIAAARQHHTGYLGAQLDVRSAEIELAVAENNALWDLSFNASAEYRGSGDSFASGLSDLGGRSGEGRYGTGLTLTIPLGDTVAKADARSGIAARIAWQQAQYALASTTREMETDVRNAVRAVEASLREVELAGKALALAETKLDIEHEKLTLGLSSNYRLISFETDLVDAQVGDVTARIGFLNALTALDRTLGTVLETWQIDLSRPPETVN